MKHFIRTTSCIAAALALGGCQSFMGALGFGPKQSSQVEQRAEVFGSEELERGRLALKQGHVAFAIQQFRMAALNERTAPDAFNGLGVAYAELGRADLAERYFKTAMELDSANPKYAANLARFYRSPLGTSQRALAMRERDAAEALAMAQKAAEENGLLGATGEVERRGVVTLQRPDSSSKRVIGNEVRISSASQGAAAPQARVTEVMVRTANSGDDGAMALVGSRSNQASTAPRITLIGGAAPRSVAPARITLTRGGEASAPSPANYPVRVALKRKD